MTSADDPHRREDPASDEDDERVDVLANPEVRAAFEKRFGLREPLIDPATDEGKVLLNEHIRSVAETARSMFQTLFGFPIQGMLELSMLRQAAKTVVIQRYVRGDTTVELGNDTLYEFFMDAFELPYGVVVRTLREETQQIRDRLPALISQGLAADQILEALGFRACDFPGRDWPKAAYDRLVAESEQAMSRKEFSAYFPLKSRKYLRVRQEQMQSHPSEYSDN